MSPHRSAERDTPTPLDVPLERRAKGTVKVRIETTGATWKGTRIYVDDVDVTARCKGITFDHQAGEPATLKLVLMKHRDGQPYIDKDAELAIETLEWLATEETPDDLAIKEERKLLLESFKRELAEVRTVLQEMAEGESRERIN